MVIFHLQVGDVWFIIQTMSTIIVELDEETAAAMLPLLEKQQTQKIQEAEQLASQIAKLKEALGHTSDSGAEHPVSQPVGVIEKTSTGRHRKGASRKIIADFLKARNGAGTNIKEISIDTKTVYGTARRALQVLEKERKAVCEGGLWRWVALARKEDAEQKSE